MDWRANSGSCPEVARGKRIRVVLERDREKMTDAHGLEHLNPMALPGWAADGRSGCRWSRHGSPFDIAFYKVI